MQSGRIDDPSGDTFYAYPSIAVNEYDDVESAICPGLVSALIHWLLHFSRGPARIRWTAE